MPTLGTGVRTPSVEVYARVSTAETFRWFVALNASKVSWPLNRAVIGTVLLTRASMLNWDPRGSVLTFSKGTRDQPHRGQSQHHDHGGHATPYLGTALLLAARRGRGVFAPAHCVTN